MGNPLRVLSLGGGVQSTTLLLMILEGEFGETAPTCAIFADTQWEPKAVYEHLNWLEGVAQRRGFPVYRVQEGDLRNDAMKAVAGERGRFASMPLFVPRRVDAPKSLQAETLWDVDPAYGPEPVTHGASKLRRQCTKEYKIFPVRHKIRELLGVSRPAPGSVELWMGISLDESQRMKDSNVKYIVHRYPLVDRKVRRSNCIAWLGAHNYPEPPKSSCIGCPFHDDAYWARMKQDSPAEFADAAMFDRSIRRLPRVDGEAFLHRSLIPLTEIDFAANANRPQDAANLWGEFEGECEGMCGV